MNRSILDTGLQRLSEEFEGRSEAELIVIATIWGTISLMTLIGNFITLFIVFRNRNLWTPTNMLVASLAFADFGFALFNVVPIGTTNLASREWVFSEGTCQFQGFTAIMFAAASIETLGCTAVNRFYRIVKPAHYNRYFSKTRTSIIILITWILAALAPTPYVAAGHEFIYQPAKGFCYLKIDSGAFTAFLVGTYIGIPASAICYCYLRVFLEVRKHNAQISQSRNFSAAEIRITKTLFIIVFVFMCCWTPVLIIDVIDTITGRWIMPRWVYLMYSFLTLISSVVNPVIYVIMNPAFRKEYIRFITCSSCRKKVLQIASMRASDNQGAETSSTAV